MQSLEKLTVSKVNILEIKPRVYIASKLQHADMWKTFRKDFPSIDFTCRWLDIEPLLEGKVSLDYIDKDKAREVWDIDFRDVRTADFCIVYAKEGEHLKGGLVEAGMCIASGGKVIVIGEHPDYSSWQYHRQVYHEPSVIRALINILDGCYAETT